LKFEVNLAMVIEEEEEEERDDEGEIHRIGEKSESGS
jgi:hypothetical protein